MAPPFSRTYKVFSDPTDPGRWGYAGGDEGGAVEYAQMAAQGGAPHVVVVEVRTRVVWERRAEAEGVPA